MYRHIYKTPLDEIIIMNHVDRFLVFGNKTKTFLLNYVEFDCLFGSPLFNSHNFFLNLANSKINQKRILLLHNGLDFKRTRF